MEKVLLLSDTHGLVEEVKEVVQRDSYTHILHGGDFCVDPHEEPFASMIMVQGNNDLSTHAPIERIFEWQGIRFFLAHGHTYQVYYSLLQLKYKALEMGADVVLFGHTHFPVCLQEEIIMVNPGSLKNPRGYKVPLSLIHI